MKRRSLFCLLIIAVMTLVNVSPVSAQTQAITDGLSWLASNQNADGSWGGTSADTTTPYHSTTTVIDTLFHLNSTDSAYTNAIDWISSQQIDNTRYLSLKITSLARAGIDISLELNTILSYKNEDGGFGEYLENTSGISYTTFALNALQALKAINYPDLDLIGRAIWHLLATQNDDGGWGFYKGDESNVYMTALVSITLQQFSLTLDIATAINKATDYLIAHQNIDGGFGSSESAVYETALSYIALVGEITDMTVFGSAINYLKVSQLPDGSWNDDGQLSVITANTGLTDAEDILVQFYDGKVFYNLHSAQ